MLSLFAGLRTVDLGYDTKLYVLNTYNFVSSGMNLGKIFSIYGMEKGFVAYSYFIYHINPNFNFLLFALNIPVNIIFVIFMYHFKDNKSIPLLTTIYYCTLYAFSFNIIRQSISLSMFLLMLIFVDKGKKIPALTSFIIGFLFHSSMIFSIIALFIMWFSNNNKISRKYKIVSFLFIIISMIIMLISYENIINLAYNIGIISQRYLDYLNTSSSNYRTTIDIEYSLLFLKTAILTLAFLYYKGKNIETIEKQKEQKWFVMLIIDYIITLLSFKLANTDRISWYLYYPAIFMFTPKLEKIFKKDKLNRSVGKIIIAGIFIIYLLEKLITNQYHICPYRWIF